MNWLYLAPDLALAIVICRLVWLGMMRTRPALVIFLYAWLAYSCSTLLLPQSWRSAWLDLGIWLVAAPALWRISRELRPLHLLGALLALLPAFGLAEDVLIALGPAARIFAAHSAVAFIAGTFLLLAGCTPDADALRTLYRGTGAWFLFYANALPMAAIITRGAPGSIALVVICLGSTLIWLALAWFLAPRGDAIVNDERLALTTRRSSLQSAGASVLKRGVRP